MRAVPKAIRLAAIAAAGTLLAACGAGAQAAPTWSPQAPFSAEGPQPSLPGAVPNQPQQPGAPGGGGPNNPGSPGSPSTPATDPAVVASHLSAPTGIALLPDGTALVGERTTGRILRVQPKPGQPVTVVRTLTGLAAAGGGGLLDLALSPTFDEDGLVYAYITTPTDNRVIHFTLTGPATPVLTGIPKGPSDNTGRIAFDSAGHLYVGTGDAGTPAHAADPASLAGKVLRVDDIGNAADGNPSASPVYARGLRTVDGLCIDASTGAIYVAQARSASTPDEIDVLRAGADYGWPAQQGNATDPAATLPATAGGVGGCTVEGHTLFVTSRDGMSLQAAPVTGGAGAPRLGDFGAVLTKTYGRLLTVVAAPDGALWITTSNRDGHGKPIAADERVLRILPSGGGAGSPPV